MTRAGRDSAAGAESGEGKGIMHRTVAPRARPPQSIVTLVAALSAAIRFTSTFKSLDAGAVNFAGKKVAALVISNDDSLRVAGEESLARELSARGMQAVATYRIAPKEELRSAETARPWFEKANVEGVVAVRPVSAETRAGVHAEQWVSRELRHAVGLLRLRVERRVRARAAWQRETLVVVETTVYSVPRNQLLWAAVTETHEPARPARVRRGAGEGVGRGDAEAGAGPAPAALTAAGAPMWVPLASAWPSGWCAGRRRARAGARGDAVYRLPLRRRLLRTRHRAAGRSRRRAGRRRRGEREGR